MQEGWAGLGGGVGDVAFCRVVKAESFNEILHPLLTPGFTYVAFFFLKDPAPPDIYPLPLHDALPIPPCRRSAVRARAARRGGRGRAHGSRVRAARSPARSHPGRAGRACTTTRPPFRRAPASGRPSRDRKSTRLNSSHLVISYAVFCLK